MKTSALKSVAQVQRSLADIYSDCVGCQGISCNTAARRSCHLKRSESELRPVRVAEKMKALPAN